MSSSICSGCQTAADVLSVFTFLSPPVSTYAGRFSLWARTKAPPPPLSLTLLPPTPPLTNHHHLAILAMHSLQAAAGPQRRTWYTLCRETRNPMQFKSERSSDVKLALADMLYIVIYALWWASVPTASWRFFSKHESCETKPKLHKNVHIGSWFFI